MSSVYLSFPRSLCISHCSCCLRPSCIRLIVFSVVSRSLQYTRHHVSYVVSGTPVHLVLLTLPCRLDVPTASEVGAGTHGCRNSVLLHYSVYSFRDSLPIWENHWTPVSFVLFPTVDVFRLFCVVCDLFQGFFLSSPPPTPPTPVVIVSHLFISILTTPSF